MAANVENMLAVLRADPMAQLLDLGCDDGALTTRFAAAAGAERVVGVEIVAERVAAARGRGIDVLAADLGAALPFEDEAFGVVCSNQVIEHVADTDTFVAECFRVTVRGGYALISTENLASWHNVVSLALGWQPFSLSNVTGRRLGVGNPLAVHRGEEWSQPETWQHQRVFAFRGLVELCATHGFVVEAVRGAGYYPLPARVGRVDPRHAAFLVVKARRPH